MAFHNPVYFVRHGRYNPQWNGLTPAGIEHAQQARDELLARGIGHTTVALLSSRAAQAIQTAQIIGRALDCTPLPSNGAGRYGNYPSTLRDRHLDDMLEAELAVHGLSSDAVDSLIVVTHGPLIAAVKREPWDSDYELDRIAPHGSIAEYVPGTWVTPNFTNLV